MRSTVTGRRAARVASVGLVGMAVYQLLLAADAPFGEAAWGGSNEGPLPTGLRIGSGIFVFVYAAGPERCRMTATPLRPPARRRVLGPLAVCDDHQVVRP